MTRTAIPRANEEIHRHVAATAWIAAIPGAGQHLVETMQSLWHDVGNWVLTNEALTFELDAVRVAVALARELRPMPDEKQE